MTFAPTEHTKGGAHVPASIAEGRPDTTLDHTGWTGQHEQDTRQSGDYHRRDELQETLIVTSLTQPTQGQTDHPPNSTLKRKDIPEKKKLWEQLS